MNLPWSDDDLTTHQAAELIGLSERHVRRWCEFGYLGRKLRPGGAWYINRDEWLQFLEITRPPIDGGRRIVTRWTQQETRDKQKDAAIDEVKRQLWEDPDKVSKSKEWKALTARERQVLSMRNAMDGTRTMTAAQIAETLGLTTNGVYAIQKKAIEKLAK